MKNYKFEMCSALLPLGLVMIGLSGCTGHATPREQSQAPLLNAKQQIAAGFSLVKAGDSPNGQESIQDTNGSNWTEGLLTVATPITNVGTDTLGNDLESLCNAEGGTLPSPDQLNGLAILMGRDSNLGYHPESFPGSLPKAGLAISNNSNGALVSALDLSTGKMEDISTQVTPSTASSTGAICFVPSDRQTYSCSWVDASGKSSDTISISGPMLQSVKSDDGAVTAQVQFGAADKDGNIKASVSLTNNSDANAADVVSTPATISTSDATKNTAQGAITVGSTAYTYSCALQAPTADQIAKAAKKKKNKKKK